MGPKYAVIMASITAITTPVFLLLVVGATVLVTNSDF
jgi:hypothetical protein